MVYNPSVDSVYLWFQFVCDQYDESVHSRSVQFHIDNVTYKDKFMEEVRIWKFHYQMKYIMLKQCLTSDFYRQHIWFEITFNSK